MNKTENLAKNWIINFLGYSEADIHFQSNKNPDFLLNDGYGIEVKRVKSKTLVILEAQWLDLKKHPNCFIIIFYDSVLPSAFIPVNAINPPDKWGGFTIKVQSDGMAKWREHLRLLADLKAKRLNRQEFRQEYHRAKIRGQLSEQ